MAVVSVARGVTVGIHSVAPAQVTALVALLQAQLPAFLSVTVDPSEGEGRTLATIAQYIQAGGLWISWGGYPFYYTPSQPGGNGGNFARFCQLLGVPDPNADNAGGEFFAPPNGTARALWTPTATLPSPWVADAAYPPKTVDGVTVWGNIAVPSGTGWWFYASTDYGATTAADYGRFIVQTVSPAVPTVVRRPLWPWVVGGLVVVGGAGALLLVRRR